MKQYIVYWLLVRMVSTVPEPQYDQWGRQVIQESYNTSWLTLPSDPLHGFKKVKELRKKVFYNADSAYAFYGRSKAIEQGSDWFLSTSGSVDSVRIDSIGTNRSFKKDSGLPSTRFPASLLFSEVPSIDASKVTAPVNEE